MQFVPGFWGKELFEIGLGFGHVSPIGELPPLGQPVNVSVDRKSGFTEGLGHHHGSSLVSDSGKFFEGLEIGWYFTSVLFKQDFRKPVDRFGLPWSQTAGAHNGIDLLHAELHHFSSRVSKFEESRRHDIDPSIGALGGKQDRHQKSEGIGVVQRDRRFGIELFEAMEDIIGPFLFQHSNPLHSDQRGANKKPASPEEDETGLKKRSNHLVPRDPAGSHLGLGGIIHHAGVRILDPLREDV